MGGQTLATFVRPGPMGRTVRAGFGILFAWMLFGTSQSARTFWAGDISFDPFLLMGLLAVVLLTTYMVDGILGVSWGNRVTAGIVLVGVALVVAAALTRLSLFAALYGTLIWAWMVTVATIFAAAFFLAAAIGTPGCELNSFRHLVKGDACTGRACVALIDRVDRWEEARKASGPTPWR